MKKQIKTLEQKIKDIKNVTKADIKKVAKIIFIDKHLNLALIGPSKDKGPYLKILNF
jgi:predicted Zn-dependent peptidase